MSIIGDPEDVNCLFKCDRCGLIHEFDNGGYDIRMDLWSRIIFKDVGKTWLNEIGDLCRDCAIAITPVIYSLRDVWELRTFVNKLEGNINEKRKQGIKNNRAVTHNACECCKRSNERRFRYRQSYGFTQASKEHI